MSYVEASWRERETINKWYNLISEEADEAVWKYIIYIGTMCCVCEKCHLNIHNGMFSLFWGDKLCAGSGNSNEINE